MDHVQNFEKLCQRLAVLSDRSIENRSYNAHHNNHPKTLILIWYSGALFGLTPFWSYFIDHVEADMPVKDVTKINRVIGIGTTLHKFQNDLGQDIFLPCVLYHIPQTDVRLFSPRPINKCMEDTPLWMVILWICIARAVELWFIFAARK